jgi:hypothetical protein
MPPRLMARLVLLAGFATLAANAVLAAEDKPELLGTFRDWHVYQTGKGPNRLCYALSQPKDMTPKDAKRDSVFFLISTWPVRKVRNEPSVMAGYAYKDGGKAEIQVGSDKFNFFTKNDGGAGGAWMEDAKDEKRLIDAMKKGSGMSVAGISARGTTTKDTYSLAGISAALDKLDSSCK